MATYGRPLGGEGTRFCWPRTRRRGVCGAAIAGAPPPGHCLTENNQITMHTLELQTNVTGRGNTASDACIKHRPELQRSNNTSPTYILKSFIVCLAVISAGIRALPRPRIKPALHLSLDFKVDSCKSTCLFRSRTFNCAAGRAQVVPSSILLLAKLWHPGSIAITQDQPPRITHLTSLGPPAFYDQLFDLASTYSATYIWIVCHKQLSFSAPETIEPW